MRASQKREVREPGELEVLDVLTPPGDELRVLQPLERPADIGLAGALRA
jgi:hypothetical protein